MIFDGSYIRLAENYRNAFDIAFGKLELFVEVNCYPCGEGADQSFKLNPDNTISTLKKPNLVLGIKNNKDEDEGGEGKLILVDKSSNEKCIFKKDDQDDKDLNVIIQNKPKIIKNANNLVY